MKVTNREAQALNAIVDHGSFKGACRAMGVTLNALSGRLHAARRRNGLKTNLHLILRWDRLHRKAWTP